MTYLNITAYHFCLRFSIYSSCTTLHTQLILLRKHATKRQKFEEIKRKGKGPPFPLLCPLSFTLPLCSPNPLFWRTIQILVAYPQYTSIIDMVKREIDMEKKSLPPFFFLTFPLYLKHCPPCPAKPPCFGPQKGIYKENSRPFFLNLVKREIDMGKSCPFLPQFLLYFKHCPPCPAKPPCFGPQGTFTRRKLECTRRGRQRPACLLVERERKKEPIFRPGNKFPF